MPLLRRQKAELPRRRSLDDTDQSRVTDPQNRAYVRNRTLSPLISTEESSRGQVHSLTAQRRRLGGIFLLILGVILLLALLIGQLTAQVNVTVKATGLIQPVDTAMYTKSISAYLNAHPVERLRFSLSDSQLLSYVTHDHPEVASVAQTTTWGTGTTNFAISLRQPVAGWQINHQQYYVDASGVAFQKNYFASPSVQIVDQSGATPSGGATVTSTRFLSFIGKIVSIAQGRGYSVTQAILPAGTTREVALTLQGVAPQIRLSVDRGAGEQMEDADRAIKYLASHGVTAQYIDVRISGRAYYQ